MIIFFFIQCTKNYFGVKRRDKFRKIAKNIGYHCFIFLHNDKFFIVQIITSSYNGRGFSIEENPQDSKSFQNIKKKVECSCVKK